VRMRSRNSGLRSAFSPLIWVRVSGSRSKVTGSSPGQRGRVYATLGFVPLVRAPRLALGFASSTGRGSQGQKTVLSKGSRPHRYLFRQLCKSPAGAGVLGVVVRLELRPAPLNAAALVKTALGAWYYAPASAALAPLDYFRTAGSSPRVRALTKPQGHWY